MHRGTAAPPVADPMEAAAEERLASRTAGTPTAASAAAAAAGTVTSRLLGPAPRRR